MHVLALYAREAGKSERGLIQHLKREFGVNSPVNKHPGGGGVRADKPNFLYLCVQPVCLKLLRGGL